MRHVVQSISARLEVRDRADAKLLEVQTQYLVGAAYASQGGKDAAKAATKATRAVQMVPDTRTAEEKAEDQVANAPSIAQVKQRFGHRGAIPDRRGRARRPWDA